MTQVKIKISQDEKLLATFHKEIQNKVIISKAEIAEKFGVPFDYIKIVD